MGCMARYLNRQLCLIMPSDEIFGIKALIFTC